MESGDEENGRAGHGPGPERRTGSERRAGSERGSGAAEETRFRELLREQQERFEFATEAAGIGYWFCDLPFDKLIWDERVKGHFWLPPEAEVDIDLFYAQLHPEDRERTRAAIEHSIASHTRYEVEYRTVSAGGEIKWIQATGRTAYDEEGRAIRFDGVTWEITPLKLAREALEREQQRMLALFESVPVGLVFADATGKIVSGNRRAEQIFGHPILPSKDIAAYREWEGYHADGRRIEGHEYPLARALTDGGMHTAEYLYGPKGGRQRWLASTAAPIRDSSGKIVGAVVSTEDMDPRKRAEEALMRGEKLAVVGRLAATISHEINNPLESVTNLLYLVSQTVEDASAREYCELAQQELARVSQIVTHTLQFNRQQKSALRERMSKLLDSAVAIYEARIRSSGARLEREYDAEDAARCMPSELRQVFANLIGNAFDAARAGGRVILRTRRTMRAGVPYVRVTIADTGCGMDARTQERLFEPFFTTKGENGTGLGLWVTREILTKHGAAIRVRSRATPGRSGTVFTMWLPVEGGAGARAGEGDPFASLRDGK